MKPITIYYSRYTLIDEVASGGFANIYRATEAERDGPVAIKMCKRHDDPVYAKSIMKEAELIPRFEHDNIVKVHPITREDRADVHFAYAIELANDPVFFVMEYLAGGTLEQYLQHVKALPPREAATIALAVARALYKMHVEDYGHNDLKLENVVFRETVKAGQPYTPVLIDFGVATRVLPPPAGTLYIMSPEQVKQVQMATPPENNPVDPSKIDVWGLGILLYRMLGGRLPFESRSERTLTERIIGSRPTSLRRMRSEIGTYLDELIIDGCLAKDPSDRLALLDLGRELRHFAGREPAVASHDGPSATSWQPRWWPWKQG